MANMFKPEIGVSAGTNLSAYSPPTVDYSGLFSSLSSLADSGKTEKVSEGDKKAAALSIVTESLARARQIEDPIKQEITVKKVKMNALKTNPQYTEDLNKYFAAEEGLVYEDTGGISPEDIKTQAIWNDWVAKDPDGKNAYANAYFQYGGDQAKIKGAVEVAYYERQAELADNRARKEEVDNLKLSTEAAAIQIRPLIQARVDKAYAAVVKQIPDIIKAANQKGMDSDIAVSDAIKVQIEMFKGMVQREYSLNGLTPTEADVNSYIAPLVAEQMAYENSKDYAKRSVINLAEKYTAIQLVKSDIPLPMWKGMIEGNNPELLATLLQTAGTQASLQTFVKDISALQKQGLGFNMTDQTPDVVSTPGPRLAPSDSPTDVAAMYKDVFTPDIMQGVVSASTTELQHARSLGIQSTVSFNRQNLQPEDIKAIYKSMTNMYASVIPQVDKEGISLKPEYISKLVGNSSLDTIDAVYKKDRNIGGALWNQANTFAVNGAAKLSDDIDAQLKVFGFGTQPFILKMDEKGNLNFEINQKELKTDPYLMKATGSYRYETVGRGGTKAIPLPTPAETDPYKVFDNYLSLRGSAITETAEKMFMVGGGTANEVKKKIEALQILLKQSNRIPAEIRRDIDAAELLRQKYGVTP